MRHLPYLSIPISLLLATSLAAQQSGVIVNFDPAVPSIGPFPTDYLTISDSAQKTGLTVRLPMPDCSAEPSACVEVGALNELDGFHLQPRIRIKFSNPINPSTLKSGIVFVWLDNLTNEENGLGPVGRVTAINQVIYDPATNIAYAKPTEFFDQHRRYVLVVTDAVRDTVGSAVAPDPKFTACVQSPETDYCRLLQQAVGNLDGVSLPGRVVAASVFTTMSATTWLEMARDLLSQAPAAFTPVGTPFSAANIIRINVRDKPSGSRIISVPTPPGTLAGVDRIAFGTFQSPNFFDAQQRIPYTPTAKPLAMPESSNTILLHAYIPSSPMPAGGYPVILFGHSWGENSYLTPTLTASALAQAGFVVLAFNTVGHGYGPESVVEIVQQGNVVSRLAGGGRGVDLNGDGQVGSSEGCFLVWPYPVGARDCLRQTVVDLMQLEMLLRSGAAIDPSSNLKVDPDRIYFTGISFGAMFGSALLAVDPNVRAAALNVGGGSAMDNVRWGRAAFEKELAHGLVGGRTPSLLNAGANFDDNYVLRDQPVKVNSIAGAIEIQNLFDNLEWLQAPGDPLSFGPHLSLTPLPNVPAKPVLFQFAFGDLTVPNSQTSALIRSADMFQSSTFYRTDLVASALGGVLPPGYDPHVFLVDSLTNVATSRVAQAAQQQIVGFLAADGKRVPDANALLQQLIQQPLGVTVFQTLASAIETLNFP